MLFPPAQSLSSIKAVRSDRLRFRQKPFPDRFYNERKMISKIC